MFLACGENDGSSKLSQRQAGWPSKLGPAQFARDSSAATEPVEQKQASTSRGSTPLYLAQFNFRYCNGEANRLNDADRGVRALEGIMGKRLTYQTAGRA
jgi:hypothetical protein